MISGSFESLRSARNYGLLSQGRFGDGSHNNRLGQRHSIQRPAAPNSDTRFYGLSPAAITLVAEKMSLFSKKAVLLCLSSYPRPRLVSAHIAQELADAGVKWLALSRFVQAKVRHPESICCT